MSRVKCRVCENTDGKKCLVKRVTVSQNKSRTCELFEHDVSKVRVRKSLKSTYTPFHKRTRKEYKKHMAEENKKELVEQVRNSQDCLSNFRSTAQ